MGKLAEISVTAVDHPVHAVQDADVIAVVSSGNAPVLAAEWVKPGACVISIAGGQLPTDLITRSRVTVSARDEVIGPRSRRAPYNEMIAAGEWSTDRVAAELGEILLGTIPGRVREDEIVIHEMPGLSFWDAAILAWAYDWAVRNGVGTSFNLSTSEV
jgi:ornithine cyclodeaminase